MEDTTAENLVIIPARGGSKGIPFKNIREINGKPLIAWSIEHALQSNCVGRVVVSTDDALIAEISARYGAEVPCIRPADLSTDTAPTEPAIMHMLDYLRVTEGYEPSNVILLQATSPIRRPEALDEAYSQFCKKNADSLLSVCEFWHFLWEGGATPNALYDFQNRPRRQDIQEDKIKYRENGSIYITREPYFISESNRLAGEITLYIMEDFESFEIDTELDWLLVETILTSEIWRKKC